ncbi:MAG: lipid-A-disaccharide synthase [Firmicutes bacterium]|nr:lipid-A-disaccharide synthase [Bacillota bacterium]
MMHDLKVMLVAGEASGDLHGSYLAQEILRQWPNTRLFGMGGNLMKDAGVRLLFNPTSISSIGFLEALRSAQVLRRVLLRFGEIVERQQPDAVVLIDFPGFNMRFAEILKRKGIACVYYLSPSAWAWGRSRADKVAETATKVVAVFPFEYDVYKEAGADVEFVGHPLLDIVPEKMPSAKARAVLGISGDHPLIGLLPGSRRQEIRGLLPIMLRAVEILQEKIPGIEPIVSAAHVTAQEDIQQISSDCSKHPRIIQGQTHTVLSAVDLAIVASGTATLEAALLGVPQVVVYRLASSTYFIAKLLVRIPYVALPNIVAGREVVPELLQNEASPGNIAAHLGKLWQEEERCAVQAGYEEVRRLLGEKGAISRAAGIVLDVARREADDQKA